MAILGYNGLNAPAGNFETVGAQQAQDKKMTKEQLEKWEREDRLHIGVHHKEFPDLISTMYIDTAMLSMAINGVLNTVFSDYYGSKVEIVQNRQLYSTIFFSEDSSKVPGKDQYKVLEPIISKNNFGSASSRIDAMNHFASNGRRHTYKISKKGDELLRDIIPNSAINKENLKVDWNRIMLEGAFNQSGVLSSRTYVQISIDILKMLSVMYGSRTSDGGEWKYMVNVGSPINPVMTPLGDTRANKWQLFIMRCNSKDVEEMARNLGFNFGLGNDMNIITSY